MTETRNIIGTSEDAFRIGLSGPAIYQGTADPTVTPPTPVDPSGFNNGDVYFRTFTGSEAIWQFKSGGWEESGTMLFSSSITFGAGAQILADPTAGPGAPAYSFDTNPDTGVFLPSPDTIGFSVGGTPVFNIESDGTLNALTASYETLVLADNDIPNKKYTDDTFFAKTGGILVGDLVLDTGVVVELDPAAGAGSPPLTFTGDTDTGVFRPLANTLGFTTGGVERARVNSSGLTVTAGNQFIGQTGSSAAPSFAISGSSTGWNFGGTTLDHVISGTAILTLSTTILTGTNVRFRASDGDAALPGFAFAGTVDTGMFRDAGDIGLSTTTQGEVLRIADADGVMTMGNLATNETFTIDWTGIAGATLPTGVTPGATFDASTTTTTYRFWFSDGSTTPPAVTTEVLAVIVFTGAETDQAISDLVVTALLAADVDFASAANGGGTTTVVTTSVATAGPATDAVDGVVPTSAIFITTIQGSLGYESFVSGSSNDIPNVIYVENNFLNLTGGTVAGTLTMGDQLLSFSGIAANPGVAFSAATTTGLFLSSGTNIGFTVSGSAVAAFGSTFATFLTPIELLDGSAAVPSLLFDSDPDTGIFYGGSTGEIGFSSDAAEVVTISPTGLAVNNVNATEQMVLPSYTVATVPTGVTGGMIFVTDEGGGAVPAFFDGSDWRRVTDRTIVSV